MTNITSYDRIRARQAEALRLAERDTLIGTVALATLALTLLAIITVLVLP